MPLHRLCSLMRKMGANAYMIEYDYEDEEILAEIAALNSGLGEIGDASIIRLSFYENHFDLSTYKDLSETSCMACAILIKYINPNLKNLQNFNGHEIKYIYEAYIAYPHESGDCNCLLNNYFHTGREYEVNLANNKCFRIKGTYFCQQNKCTSVCAHSALKMVVNGMVL